MSSSSTPSDWSHFYQHHNPSTTTATTNTPQSSTTTTLLTPEGRVSKPIRRRSRASRRTPTTLLNTDTSNFRAMVQQFTGGGAAGGPSLLNHQSYLPQQPSLLPPFGFLHRQHPVNAPNTLPLAFGIDSDEMTVDDSCRDRL